MKQANTRKKESGDSYSTRIYSCVLHGSKRGQTAKSPAGRRPTTAHTASACRSGTRRRSRRRIRLKAIRLLPPAEAGGGGADGRPEKELGAFGPCNTIPSDGTAHARIDSGDYLPMKTEGCVLRYDGSE